MMFSTRAEYGVRVMVALANEQQKDASGSFPASLAQIAEDNGLPFAYLEHLAARLKKAGLIESRRGPRGGYLLAQKADDITMAQIVEALEGQIAPIECISGSEDGDVTCTREGESNEICPTKILWTRVQGAIVRSLAEMTLGDLAAANQRANGRLDGAARSKREPAAEGESEPSGDGAASDAAVALA